MLALFSHKKGTVSKFETEFAKKFGAARALAFPYGRSALKTFLNSVGLNGQEVIMPAYTCSVVAHAISLSGNTPKFVDIDLVDFNLNLDELQKTISKKTGAVVATHLFGYALDMNKLIKIVREAEKKYNKKIWIIEDCAHSFGAEFENQCVGIYGDVGLYALNISKMITSIFGGMLTFQDKSLAEKVHKTREQTYLQPGLFKSLKRRLYLFAVFFAFSKPLYGLTYFLQYKTRMLRGLTDSYHLDDRIEFPPDWNEKMHDVEASVGLVQLKKYDEIIKARRKNSQMYYESLQKVKGWRLPPIVKGATYSHYVIMVDDRKKALEFFENHNVELGELIQYSVPALNSYKSGQAEFSNATFASKHTINLPVDASLDEASVKKIIRLAQQ